MGSDEASDGGFSVEKALAHLVDQDPRLADRGFGRGIGAFERVGADQVVGFRLAADFLGDVGADAPAAGFLRRRRGDGEAFVGLGRVAGDGFVAAAAAEEFRE